MRLPFPFPTQQRRVDRYNERGSMFGRPSQQGGGMSSALKMRLLIALAIAAFAVISYYAKSKDRNEVTGELERVALTDEADEVQLGLQAAPEMVGMHGGPSLDVQDQRKVQGIGNQLLDALDLHLDRETAEHPDNPLHNPYRDVFRFTLLADPETVNAFALPGGQVFITQALFDQLESDGQIAGVLGHEVGHVLSRHGNKQMARQGLFQGIAGALGVLGGDANSARMGQMVGSVLSMRYGRDAENESDEWGVKLMEWAGYDPNAMVGVMDVLERASGGGAPPEFFSTHPNSGNRKEHIKQVIAREWPEGLRAGLRP